MTRPLRIALIASCRFPIRQPFAGGLEAHVWHLATALAEHGHDVALFAAPGSDVSLGCSSLKVCELELSAAARADVSMPAQGFMDDHHAYLSLMVQLAGSHRDSFDVIHNHSLHYLPVAMAPTLSTPMLTTVHTPPTPWLESAVKATGGRGTRFAAVSEHTRAAWAPVHDSFTVVPNGIDARRWPLGDGGESAVWFGRITPEKAPHLAVAAARLAGRAIKLAGPISDAAYFATQIQPLLGDDVRYVGHLTQQRLADLVGRSAVALVTPEWDEPYGLVVAEAMSCGTPVVAFGRGGIPELVTPESGCLVPPGDVQALAAAIPAAARLSRRRVHEHAVAHCSATAMLHAYLALYRQMISAEGEPDDRLLHPPPRLRPPRTGGQHHLALAQAGDSHDLSGCATSASVLGGRHATA
ncbi:glycosyltransferase family 4 protein [Mycolicibacterium flavescens]|uniref:Glycosyl transferase family 1 n=1 Tax=Mycolicibacterium flavescens TaxID=1776 RepID=A0A1E3RI69_MYCFV|nr:glycosyltransferase family 4 protein [Mycolicibacterium flavescens]MCV7282179.1 glycosyltransferase family 4 protein [Mycolicibacterium flavescens]ODQ89561.1 glycosyl transferase family 1 [Mycolicibacterium flavescens]